MYGKSTLVQVLSVSVLGKGLHEDICRTEMRNYYKKAKMLQFFKNEIQYCYQMCGRNVHLFTL